MIDFPYLFISRFAYFTKDFSICPILLNSFAALFAPIAPKVPDKIKVPKISPVPMEAAVPSNADNEIFIKQLIRQIFF